MRVVVLIGVAILLGGCVNGSTRSSYEIVDTYSVADFMQRLDDAIMPAAIAAKTNGLLLTEVKLSFNVVLTDTDSGEVKILFVKLGGSSKTASTTEYTVTLGAPEDLADDQFGQVSVSTRSYLGNFADALMGLVADSSKYEVGDLVTHKVTASLKYFIQDKASGVLEHNFEIVPVSLNVGNAVTEEATQTILLTFEAPKEKKEE